jgi:hypothetical protein
MVGRGAWGSNETRALRSTVDFDFLGPVDVRLAVLELELLRSRVNVRDWSSMRVDLRRDVREGEKWADDSGFGDGGDEPPTEEPSVTEVPRDLCPVEETSESLSEAWELDELMETFLRAWVCCF